MDGDLQKYTAFITTAESGSFTKAAQRLGYAQSSISKMIADLEDDLGLKLLQRSRAGVRLTSDGEAMLPQIRQLLTYYREMREQAEEIRGCLKGNLRIGAFTSVATHWIPNMIREFQKDYPQIGYEVLLGDYTEIEHWIMEGRVDCGFLKLPLKGGPGKSGLPKNVPAPGGIAGGSLSGGNLSGGNLETIELEEDPLMAVLPKGHPLTKKKRIAAKDLEGQAFMLLEHSGKNEVSEFLDRYGVHPDIRFTSWDDYAIMSMAEQGLGIGILPKLVLKRIPFDVEVRPLPQDARRRIGFAMRSRETASAAVKRFLPYLECREAR